MSYFASQHERIRTIHSHIKDAKKTIDSLIESSYSVASLEDYDSKRIELRRSLTHFQTTIGTYSTTIASLRRQVDKMKSDMPEQQDSKKKEQKLFEELRAGDDGGIDYDDVSLSASLLPSIISVVDQTLAFAKSDAMTKMEIEAKKESIHQAMSIQSQPVHDSTTTQFTPILTQNEHMSTVISTLIERLNAPPLPPITLIPFDGESTQWESFYSQYSSEIGAMSHLSDHAKLVYLRNALTGAALRSVEGIPIEGKNLKSTIDRLKSVYGRSKRSNTILINQLFSIRPKSFTLEDQLECTQQLINKIHQLEDQSMVDNFALINQIAGTIHSKHLRKMYQLEPSTMKEALFHIEKDLREELEISKLESTFHSNHHSDYHLIPRETNLYPVNEKTIKSFNSKQKYSGPSCVYCGQHEYSHCTIITSLTERKAILREKKLCYKCLSSKHLSNLCDRMCQQCSKPHHKSICDSIPITPQSNQSILTATITSVDPIHTMTRLYTTSVLLQNPLTNRTAQRDVLLDNGSMVSLISRKLTQELNLKPHRSIPMTLRGFGGIPTGGSTHDVVTVNIHTTRGILPINAIVLDTSITHPMYHHPLSNDDYSIVQSKCGDHPHLIHPSSVTPDLLIAIDGTQTILNDSTTINLPSGYTLTNCIIGPIISGTPHSHQFPLNHVINHHVLISGVMAESTSNNQLYILNKSIERSTEIRSELSVQPHSPHTIKSDNIIDNEKHISVANHPPFTAISNSHSININHASITGSIPQKNLIPLKFDAHHDPPDFKSIRDHTLPHTMANAKSKCQVGGNLITSISN
ncbi:hypothetical protein PRIPAC_86138 [Pristionchus pacificus]|uniref:Uncharacterized protein n=1 Tax=Pristionchus pacificus TaxID=54126 RepID=A0A2A6BMT1_PRIPA|nr:hypothetical protein PRIPAC_86138 [Pristionchus pacificus]|eukprot:PDM67220.1 hypothetical protein PRIPAC_48637 [Pristionchus pacificus]